MSIAYLVFAQRVDATLDVEAWTAHAARFFATKLGAMTPRGSARPDAERDSVDIVVLHGDGDGDTRGQVRRIASRATSADDLALAERAERKRPGGLLHLARRCGHVYEVTGAADVAHEGDRDLIALLIAAIAASVVLGPIVDPTRVEIFGVKSARAILER